MIRVTMARAARLASACALMLVLLPWTAARAESVRIVVLGASNAAGSAVGSAAAWPAQLKAMLRAKGYDIDMSVHAARGATSEQIAGQAGAIPSGTRVVVFDVGGGNDRDSGVSEGARKANRGRIEAKIRAAGAKPVFVSYPSIVGPQKEGSAAWIAGDPHHHITAQSHRRVAAAILPRVIAAIGTK
ncbi:MAG: GDSL-type esterase/lipase family protein [Pseudolabrys sp.]